ncbi:MAG: 50S ribosomal protein L14e [Thermoproteota archaeon]|nr:MAG: 50S ribosomal protein L14e [Candidatus Korarchaeota archaeon]RLG48457.1 MAG: 50S ribosomal protein L14e [Candidatus Korarchaeota archaeon]
MGLIEVGRVCIKTAGREAGKKCVVVKIIDKNFVEITGPKELTGVRRRRVNVKHLLPLPLKIDISEDAEDSEVLEALKSTDLYKEIVKTG